jgi:cell division protein FtsI/penicillin-binding protein 2
MNSKQRIRARFVLIAVGCAAAVIIASLYSTQIIQGGSYAAKAQTQYAKPATTLFNRGTIYFSSQDGVETAAATVASGYLVYMNPKQVSDASGAYEALSNYLPSLDRASFLAKAAKPDDPYEALADHLDTASAAGIQGLGLVGISAVPETWRSYPGGTLASHELGLVGENASSSAVVGRYGLERSYDSTLARAGSGPSANVFAEIFSGIKDSVFGSGSARSGDIVTSIEPAVEAYLANVLASTSASWHPDEIGGIVMDPSTGEIVAMSSLPSFDPNDTSDVRNAGVFSDPLAEHVYEMGSIMKPLTMSAALDSGAEKPDSTYDDTGCMTENGKKICNFDGKARGVIPMQQILSQSLNVGAATIALKTGSTTFEKYFDSFGIASKSDIDLPNEAMPLVSNLKGGTDIDIATAAYGQGIAVSPVGMARALSVIANGGYVVTPHIVKEIDYADGSVKKADAPKTGPVLKPETVQEVKDMLVKVVDISLANGAIKKDHYTMAAKTGTAEIADHVNGGYYSDRYLHSFFGFFPAYSPRFIVFLYQVYPKGAQYASETLTKPYNDLATFLINYYNIQPDR